MQRSFLSAGFTLAELAIVLLILSFVLAGLHLPFSALREQSNRREAEQTLSKVQEALLGFAIAQGRLPCPATLASAGEESPLGGGVCTDPFNGFVPVTTLGISLPMNAQAQAIDPWSNPLRYAVTRSKNNVFTTTDGLKTQLAGSAQPNWNDTFLPDLRVCQSGEGANTGAAAACAFGKTSASDAVFVLVSTGKNGSTPQSRDEAINANLVPSGNKNRLFVSRTQAQAGSAEGEFDDIVLWLSPYVLYQRLMSAGRLP